MVDYGGLGGLRELGGRGPVGRWGEEDAGGGAVARSQRHQLSLAPSELSKNEAIKLGIMRA